MSDLTASGVRISLPTEVIVPPMRKVGPFPLERWKSDAFLVTISRKYRSSAGIGWNKAGPMPRKWRAGSGEKRIRACGGALLTLWHEAGVLVGVGGAFATVIRLQPTLTLSAAEADRICDVVKTAGAKLGRGFLRFLVLHDFQGAHETLRRVSSFFVVVRRWLTESVSR